METPTKIIKDVVNELANEQLHAEIRSEVTAADALPSVDHDLVIAWVAVETGTRSPQTTLLEVFENLTDAETISVLNCLLNETDTARRILADALRQHVAKDLAGQANVVLRNYEPTDSEISRSQYAAMARAESAAFHRGEEVKW